MEKDNSKHFRDYYESGCLCLLTGKLERFTGDNNLKAVNYYDENCQCSRNVNSANMKCWDRNKSKCNYKKGVIMTHKYLTKYVKDNENLIVIGAPRTGKTLFLQNLQSDISANKKFNLCKEYNVPDNEKFYFSEKHLKNGESFLKFLTEAQTRSLELNENIFIFIDSECSEEILEDNILFKHLYRFVTESNNLIFYIALNLNPSPKNLPLLVDSINNRFFLFDKSLPSQCHIKISENICTEQLPSISFDEILKDHLKIFENK